MELWIRSQNKTILSKVHDLVVREDRNENNEINYFIVDTYVLGIYKTKERALEILDEIHQRILSNDMLNIYSNQITISNLEEKEISELGKLISKKVYEMPKE